MTAGDLESLRDLMESVYVTPRQRDVLRRLVGAELQRLPRRTLDAASAIPEAERIDLLGPCGAE